MDISILFRSVLTRFCSQGTHSVAGAMQRSAVVEGAESPGGEGEGHACLAAVLGGRSSDNERQDRSKLRSARLLEPREDVLSVGDPCAVLTWPTPAAEDVAVCKAELVSA